FLSCAAHRIERPLIVFAGTVNGAHDWLIALDQQRGVHSSLEIERASSVVPGSFSQQTPFALESLPQLRLRQRIKQAYHRQRNRALANEIDLELKNVCGIVIKPDDET